MGNQVCIVTFTRVVYDDGEVHFDADVDLVSRGDLRPCTIITNPNIAAILVADTAMEPTVEDLANLKNDLQQRRQNSILEHPFCVYYNHNGICRGGRFGNGHVQWRPHESVMPERSSLFPWLRGPKLIRKVELARVDSAPKMRSFHDAILDDETGL